MSSSTRPQARRGPSGAWNRLKSIPVDPLDVYGLPSKGETRLFDPKTQETYYAKIVERYMKFCAASKDGDALEKAFATLAISESTESAPKPASSTPSTIIAQSEKAPPSNDMPNILMAMRKLREGILSSRRRDSFAQRAYMFIIHVSLLSRNWESYLPALLYLLNHIHPHTPLSSPELNEFVGYHVLDLACRQHKLLEAYTLKRKYLQRDRKVHTVLSALVQDDWVRFWRVRRAVDGYQRALLEFSIERMRLHALKCLGRSYMSADRGFVERSADASWEDLVKNNNVGWQLQENGNVIIRKPKAK